MPADELPIVPEIVPALLICQSVPEPPLTASPLAVVVMLPVLVIVRGVLDALKWSWPLTAVLIVWPAIGFSRISPLNRLRPSAAERKTSQNKQLRLAARNTSHEQY
jgi:hypothetical protein